MEMCEKFSAHILILRSLPSVASAGRSHIFFNHFGLPIRIRGSFTHCIDIQCPPGAFSPKINKSHTRFFINWKK